MQSKIRGGKKRSIYPKKVLGFLRGRACRALHVGHLYRAYDKAKMYQMVSTVIPGQTEMVTDCCDQL